MLTCSEGKLIKNAFEIVVISQIWKDLKCTETELRSFSSFHPCVLTWTQLYGATFGNVCVCSLHRLFCSQELSVIIAAIHGSSFMRLYTHIHFHAVFMPPEISNLQICPKLSLKCIFPNTVFRENKKKNEHFCI